VKEITKPRSSPELWKAQGRDTIALPTIVFQQENTICKLDDFFASIPDFIALSISKVGKRAGIAS